MTKHSRLSMLRACAVGCFGIGLWGSVALGAEPAAQASPGAATPGEAAQSTSETPPASTSTHELEANALYRLGLYVLGKGQLAEAHKILERVTRDYSDTPARALAAARMVEIEQAQALPDNQRQRSSEALANSGRAEFVVSQTVVGGVAGWMIPALIQTDENNAYIGGIMAGTVAGLAGALAVTSKIPLNETQAGLVYYSQLFTAWNTTMWSLALTDGQAESVIALPALIGLGAGTALGGYLATHHKELPSGRLSLVAGAGIWTPIVTELALLAVGGDNLQGKVYQVAGPLMTDVGIAGAIALSHTLDWRVSRSRMRLINLGGGVGMLLGFGFASMGETQAQGTAALTLVGTAGGLLAAVMSTQNWDKQYHPEIFAGAPTNSVLTWDHGHVRLGEPMPQVSWATQAKVTDSGRVMERQPRVSLNVLSGSF